MEKSIALWGAGQVEFSDLLREYSHLTHETLAAEMGIPLPHHVVSVRHTEDGDWPREDAKRLVIARLEYNAGLVEMTTGKHLMHFILYSIPRKRKAPARTYFPRWLLT